MALRDPLDYPTTCPICLAMVTTTNDFGWLCLNCDTGFKILAGDNHDLDPAAINYRAKWKFRAECWRDVHVLSDLHWPEHRILLLSLKVERPNPELPDVTGTLVFGYTTEGGFIRGLRSAARAIAAIDDTHVIVESLKHARVYDGERNGPFAK